MQEVSCSPRLPREQEGEQISSLYGQCLCASALFITVCNKVDDVNLAKQKRAPTMTAPVPATYVVQG